MSDDPAKARFFLLQLLRWSGLALVLVGLLVVNGKTVAYFSLVDQRELRDQAGMVGG